MRNHYLKGTDGTIMVIKARNLSAAHRRGGPGRYMQVKKRQARAVLHYLFCRSRTRAHCIRCPRAGVCKSATERIKLVTGIKRASAVMGE